MAAGKQRLELTWIGKDNRPKLEPRILMEDNDKSYHAPHRVSDGDLFDNRLIFGDNLLALKALEAEFAGNHRTIQELRSNTMTTASSIRCGCRSCGTGSKSLGVYSPKTEASGLISTITKATTLSS
jgi:hypothetical protein